MCKNLKSVLTFLCLSSIFMVNGADVVSWDFASNQNPPWGSPRGLTLKQANGCLTLDVTAWDSSIANSNANIDPKKVSRFVIKYRAVGFPANTTGQIFFAADSMPAYHGDYYFRVPSLISDNQWHDLEISAEKDLKLGETSWNKFNRITKIRLDLANQFPGRIEIKSIQLLPPGKVLLQSLDSTNAQGILVPFSSFDGNSRVLNVPAGKYQLWTRIKDETMILNDLQKLKISGNGEFAPAKLLSSGRTMDFKWFKLGELIAAGGSLTLSLPGRIDENYDNLLLTEQNVNVEDVVKAWPKKVKSEIVLNYEPQKWLEMDSCAPYWTGMMIYAPEDDPGSGMAYPRKFYVRRTFEVPADLKDAWLQMMADDSFETYINGKKVPELQSVDWANPQLADVKKYLVPGAKNVLAIYYINKGGPGGVLFDLVLNKQDKTFNKIVSDVTARSYVREQPGWQNANFDDRTWSPVIAKPAAPYEPWKKVLRYIDKANSAGTVKCLAVDCPQKITLGTPLSISLDLKCEPALKKDEPIYVRLYSIRGKVVTYRSSKLADLKSRLSEDGVLHVTVDGFKLPEYGPGETYSMKFGVYGRTMDIPDTLDNKQIECGGRPIDASPVVSKVVMVNGTPQLMVNDKPFYPVFGDIYYDMAESGFNKIPVNVRAFSAGGMANEWWTGPGRYDFTEIDRKINKVMADNPKALLAVWIWTQPPPWWNTLHPGEVAKFSDGTAWEYYVSTPTFSSSEYLKDACAAVNAFIQHCEKYYGGKFIGYNLCGGVSFEWQGWGSHTADKYNRMQDYSPAAERDFRQFISKNYPAAIRNINTLKVPAYKERFSSDGSSFRNPVTDLPSIIYDQYYSESIASCIAKLAKTAKKACDGKKIIGAYYGYAFEYGNMRFCVNSGGHNALNVLLQSPDIDFILSPPSYGVRGIGYSGGDMKPFASIAAAGKLSIIEDDTRTHLTSPRDYYQTINEEQTSAVLRRNFGMALSRKQPICLLPIDDGLNFSSPAVIKDIQTVKKAGDFIYQKQFDPAGEIAVVIDEDSARYISPDKRMTPLKNEIIKWYDHAGYLLSAPRPSMYLTGELYYWQRIALSQIGAPVDYILLSDINKKIGKYKLWIILNGFRYNKELEETVSRLKASDTTVLWLYAPGYVGGADLSVGNMRLLTGINFKKLDKPEAPVIDIDNYSSPFIRNIKRPTFGVDYELNPLFYVDDKDAETLGHYRGSKKPALAVKKSGNSNFLFCGSNLVTTDLLTSIAQAAGVHIYTDSADNLFAGCGFLTIHAANDGTKRIRLKTKADVVDLFSGKTIACNVDSFNVKMNALTTRVFYVGNAREFKDFMGYVE